MSIKSAVQWAITLVLLVVMLSLVAGQLLGQPLLIGYVETGSMEPTLEIGDGFIAVPTFMAGDISEGDVVTFDAQSLDGGGITTHRVAEETAEGYITRGDGNTFDDQEAGEPPVQDAQIMAVVLQHNGEVVVLPSIGDGAEYVQNAVGTALGLVGLDGVGSYGIASTTTGIGVILVVSALLYDFVTGRGRHTGRSTDRTELIDSKWLLAALIVVLILPVMTSMVVPSDTESVEVLSVGVPDDDEPTRIMAGESETIEYTVENNQYVPKVVVIEPESQGIQFSESVVTLSHGEQTELTMELSVPDEYGHYSRSRAEHHYLHVLPLPVIMGLHSIHPYVAMLTISLVVLSPVIVLFLLFVGLRPVSIRPVYD